MAKGGYEVHGEPLTPEEAFPEVVEFFEHCRPDRGREELNIILTQWREIADVVAGAANKQLAMQALMERFPLGQPAVLLIFDLKIGDLTVADRAMILSVSPP